MQLWLFNLKYDFHDRNISYIGFFCIVTGICVNLNEVLTSSQSYMYLDRVTPRDPISTYIGLAYG